MIQMMNGSDGSSRGNEKSDYGYIVRLEPTGFVERFEVECERYVNKDFGPSN